MLECLHSLTDNAQYVGKFSDKYSAKHFYLNLNHCWNGQSQGSSNTRWPWVQEKQSEKMDECLVGHTSLTSFWNSVNLSYIIQILVQYLALSPHSEKVVGSIPFCVEFAPSPWDCVGSPRFSGLRPTESSEWVQWLFYEVINGDSCRL